jgi:hypothetical protein
MLHLYAQHSNHTDCTLTVLTVSGRMHGGWRIQDSTFWQGESARCDTVIALLDCCENCYLCMGTTAMPPTAPWKPSFDSVMTIERRLENTRRHILAR